MIMREVIECVTMNCGKRLASLPALRQQLWEHDRSCSNSIARQWHGRIRLLRPPAVAFSLTRSAGMAVGLALLRVCWSIQSQDGANDAEEITAVQALAQKAGLGEFSTSRTGAFSWSRQRARGLSQERALGSVNRCQWPFCRISEIGASIW